MRDPERIDVLLEYVRKHWKEYPDLRLTQLIENIAWKASNKKGQSRAVEGWAFNMEDDVMVEVFKDMYPATGMLDVEVKKEIEG